MRIFMINLKWFVYTVVFALMPFLIKLGIYCLFENCNTELRYDVLDLIIFALLLNITTINYIEIFDGQKDFISGVTMFSLFSIMLLVTVYVLVIMIRYQMIDGKYLPNDYAFDTATWIIGFISILFNYRTHMKVTSALKT